MVICFLEVPFKAVSTVLAFVKHYSLSDYTA